MTETDKSEKKLEMEGIWEDSEDISNTLSVMMQYNTQTEKYPVLPDDQIKDLVKKAQNGDFEARDLIVHSNLRLLRSIAVKYLHHSNEELMDYINEGVFGLLNAIDKFDFDKGTKFSTYAEIWIKQSISRYIREEGNVIHIPSYMADRKAIISRAEAAFKHKHHTEPTEKELAEETGLTTDQIRNTKKAFEGVASLDCMISEEEDSTLINFVPSEEMSIEDKLMQQSLVEAVHRLINRGGLTEKEKQVLVYRYGLNGMQPMTLYEVGNIYGLTRERIRQIENQAILKLRRKSWSLRDYL